MGDYIVYLGAIGWAHGAWKGDFYPEDMPGDWQLSFYNTQFRCVYLPRAVWRNASVEEVANWLGETREGFRFILEGGGELDEEGAAKARRFGDRGVLESQVNIVWLEGEPELRDLAQRMQQAAQDGVPLYLISREASLAQLRKTGELMEVLGV